MQLILTSYDRSQLETLTGNFNHGALPTIFILLFTGLSDCKICPVGYYCTSGSHVPVPCPPGSYNPALMQGSLGDCRQCIAGMACPQYGLDWPSEVCSAGHFCPAGSSQPNETTNACHAGTYTDYHNLTASRECTACPAGQACSAGTGGRQKPPQLCATGMFIVLLNLNVFY